MVLKLLGIVVATFLLLGVIWEIWEINWWGDTRATRGCAIVVSAIILIFAVLGVFGMLKSTF